MDIADLNYKGMAEGGYTFALVHDETGEETDIKITVVGADSRIFNKARKKAITRANADEEFSDDLDAINAFIYAHCVVSIENLEINGEPFVYSLENTIKLLDQYPWVCIQVAEAVGSRANFTKPPKKS